MSKFQIYRVHRICQGLAVFKTRGSPFWRTRIWHKKQQKYSVRSTKCELLADAIEEAHILCRQNAIGRAEFEEVETETFESFAKQLTSVQRQMVNTGQRGQRFAYDDEKLLHRQHDGILNYFGDRQVDTIRTQDLRDYLEFLDDHREGILSANSKSKHLIVIRKILNLAREKGVIAHLPLFPKLTSKDTPRASFTSTELQTLIEAIRECEKSSRLHYKGHSIGKDLLNLCAFLSQTGIRPTVSEVFSLRHRDVTSEALDASPHLHITIKKGKTGFRTVYSTTDAVGIYQDIITNNVNTGPQDFVFFPQLTNRTYAAAIASRQFRTVLTDADLERDHLNKRRTLYSLRHHYIQHRLSEGVGIYDVSVNAGTSVAVIERFYDAFPIYSPRRAKMLNNQI